MPRPVREVSDMLIDEISLVDVPANQHAAVLIAKRATEEDSVPNTEIYDETGQELDIESLELGEVVYDAEGQAFEVVPDDDDTPNDFNAMGEAQEEAVTKSFAGGMARGASMAGRGGNTGAVADRVGGQTGAGIKTGAFMRRNRAALGAGTAAAAGGAAGASMLRKSFADEIREELSKAASDFERDEVITKALDQVGELSKRLEVAEEIAKAEQDLRLDREYIEVAKSYNLPVDPDELGPVLKRMSDAMSYEDCAVIAKALETSGGLIFDEVGYIGGADNVDVFSQVEEAIDGAIAKSDGSVSKAAAVTEFFDGNPDAYEAYLRGE
jgi:hypothetical protein